MVHQFKCVVLFLLSNKHNQMNLSNGAVSFVAAEWLYKGL